MQCFVHVNWQLCYWFLSKFCVVINIHRHNDPLYLKIKKLEVLSKLVTESNGKEILDELRYDWRTNRWDELQLQDCTEGSLAGWANGVYFQPISISCMFIVFLICPHHLSYYLPTNFWEAMALYPPIRYRLPLLVIAAIRTAVQPRFEKVAKLEMKRYMEERKWFEMEWKW